MSISIEKPALKTNPSSSHSSRKISAIKRIIIHHSATTSGDVVSFNNYHINTNGWYMVGYHYVIKKDGTIQQGRPLTVVGAHAGNNNYDSVGICLVGNFEKEKPTEKQYDSLAKLIKYVKEEVGKDLTVICHRDVNNTACPGKNFNVKDIKEIEVKAKASYMVYVGPYTDKATAEKAVKALTKAGYKKVSIEVK